MDEAIHNNQPQFDRICQKMKRLLIKKQNLINSTPQEVVPRIFLANYTFSINKKFLTTNQIAFVITCVKIDQKDRVKGVTYKQLQIKDKPDEKINEHFEQISLLISSFLANNSDRNCLINCFSGKSRSPTLLISYLINTRKISFQQASQLVKKKYPNAEPNSGFVSQLKQYQKKFQPEVRLQRRESMVGEKEEKKEDQQQNNKEKGCSQQQQEKGKVDDQRIEKQQELILSEDQNERKEEIIAINPITHLQIGEENINNEGEQNEKFQLLEGSKIQQNILSQNSVQQLPIPQQHINILNQKQQNLIQPQLQEGRKKQLPFEGTQSHSLENQQAIETRIQNVQASEQQKQEKDVQRQENKSENQEKAEVAVSSEPRKKKKKHKKKKVEN